MLELIVLFALAALGSFFREEETARASAVAVPVPGSGPKSGQDQSVRNRVHTRDATAGSGATDAFMSNLKRKLTAPEVSESTPETKVDPAPVTRSAPNPAPSLEATPVSSTPQQRPAPSAEKALAEKARAENICDPALGNQDAVRADTSDLPLPESLAGDVSDTDPDTDPDTDTIVVVVPQDYDGPCDISIADAPLREGRPAAHILVDGQIVAELAGVRAVDIPLESVTVVEEEFA